MYFEIRKNSISNEITQKIFDQSTEIIKPKRRKIPCSYFNFNEKHQEPTKLMKLRIFNYNVDTFQSMLKGEIDQKVCSLIRFIYKCILIYRDMNSKYCSGTEGTKEKNKSSCEIIGNFNSFYTSFISSISELTHKFPELTSDIPLNDIHGCSLKGINSDEFSDETQLGTSITKGVSTAVGAMVGIPPFLALIYKVNIIFIQIYEQYLKHTIIVPCSIQ
ncbi:hypothetical protein PVIIG_06351 [Plasmodium vivax India VII]|uniref:Uncharacterized protein n=1 Tax=Plasmodium vivax India VII TaxID=1077284 RepID=A0A0J9S311_PLAVI|nr:hypothetical protein PVIIG_06351 [Plasmodium vivax India VII]